MGLIDVVRQAAATKLSNQEEEPHSLIFPPLSPSWLLSASSSSSTALLEWIPVPPVADRIRTRVAEEQTILKELCVAGSFSSNNNNNNNNKETLTRESLEKRIGPFLNAVVSENVVAENPPQGRTADRDFHDTLRLSAPFLSPVLLSTLLRVCVDIGVWQTAVAVLDTGLVSGASCSNVVESLIAQKDAYTLSFYISKVKDPRPSDSLSVLRFLLCSFRPFGKRFHKLATNWRKAALHSVSNLAKQRDSQDRKPKAEIKLKETTFRAVLLAVANDGFLPNEMCLHFLVASGIDETVLSFIVSQISVSELRRLMVYLEKWLKKLVAWQIFSKTPLQVGGLWIPSSPQILQWIVVILDTHYTSLVLSSDFHTYLTTLQSLSKELVSIGHAFSSLVGITEHLRSNSVLPHHGYSAVDDHVVEYLDIS